MALNWWRLIAPVYSKLRGWPPMRQILQQEQKALYSLLDLSTISAYQSMSDGLALDIGTGSGDSIAALPAAPRVLLDPCFEMVQRAPGTLKMVSRAEHLPFASPAFSFLSAVGVLEYVARPEVMFAEMAHVSRPAAWLLLTSAPRTFPNLLRHLLGARLHLRDDQEVEALASTANWQVQRRCRTFMQSQWLLRLAVRHENHTNDPATLAPLRIARSS